MDRNMDAVIDKLSTVKSKATGIPFDYWYAFYKMRYDFDTENLKIKIKLEESRLENEYLQEILSCEKISPVTEERNIGFAGDFENN